MNWYKKKMVKFVKRDKIQLKLEKQFLIGKDNKKFDWKNIKYIIKKIINSYSVKLDMFKGFNNVFYVDKLCLINIDFFLSQFVSNVQFFLIQKDEEEGFVIEDIMAEVKNKKGRGWRK